MAISSRSFKNLHDVSWKMWFAIDSKYTFFDSMFELQKIRFSFVFCHLPTTAREPAFASFMLFKEQTLFKAWIILISHNYM